MKTHSTLFCSFARVFALGVLLVAGRSHAHAPDRPAALLERRRRQAGDRRLREGRPPTQGSPKFVPPAERIATFDQDGTLWVEHPMYSQVMYCPRAACRRWSRRSRSWPRSRPFSTVLEILKGDRAAIAKLTDARPREARSLPR
ncbi:MAG: hypothetical protein MZV65_18205 [Chromatiales bacterium]|nr:hypothetical protein [Chromatiales bacterium]